MQVQKIVLCAVLTVSGCAMVTAPAHPVGARLAGERLVVEMSDNSRCQAEWAAGSGRIADCAGGISWQVDVDDRPNPLRYFWAELFGALGGKTILAPMADITLSDAAGRRYVFRSPNPADTRGHEREDQR